MKIAVESRLKEILDERGIKQSHFVKKFKMSATTLSALYRGESLPTLAYALVIANELGLKVEDIWAIKNKEELLR
ncbi:helix-turn-helix transcriptional regulator [Bacillus sp. ISL-7]|uniref:helix-turn-helix transcriptional regulator n=1 Tax=Bacillus sp. ISL-7 TaxID=2819136 RepID=UPI001BEA379F|nr:helix-turn-helix transcriptional regulator [Bacillus sp. ISL-7]MBT2735122.1 helix-turn-helix transcriptional regulator [Bacillus sp. ISL-7]